MSFGDRRFGCTWYGFRLLSFLQVLYIVLGTFCFFRNLFVVKNKPKAYKIGYTRCLRGRNRVPSYFGERNDPRTPSNLPSPTTTRRWPHFRRVDLNMATTAVLVLNSERYPLITLLHPHARKCLFDQYGPRCTMYDPSFIRVHASATNGGGRLRDVHALFLHHDR